MQSPLKNFRFNRALSEEERRVLSNDHTSTLQNSSVTGSRLPQPVQRYFEFALEERNIHIRNARLSQTGLFRIKEDPELGEEEGWLPLKAEQYFNTNQLAFLWTARIKMGTGIWVKGWDKYDYGEGNMLWKLFSTVTIVNERGDSLRQGSLSRYLAELPWMPTALLPGPHLYWDAIDAHNARATITDFGVEVALVFEFADDGRILRTFMPNRYRLSEDKYIPTPWSCTYSDYRKVDGMMIPFSGEVAWELEYGSFKYAAIQIEKIEYNVAEPY